MTPPHHPRPAATGWTPPGRRTPEPGAAGTGDPVRRWGAPAPVDPEQAAYLVLLRLADAESWPATDRARRRLLRRARAAAHPDRRDGDRSAWDDLEDAARVLGLI